MRLWIASLYFYAFVFLLCEFLRFITRKLLEERAIAWKHHLLIVSLIYEFIGTLQICVPMFDVNFVLDNYGLSGVFLEICFIEFLNAFLLRNALADPCSLFYNYAKGRQSIRMVSLILAVQFIAGYSSFFVARQFFALGLHPQHQNALGKECSADLTVAILYGSIVEALGLFAGKMAEHWIDETVLDPKHINLALSLISALITVLGINLTGMYANPIVAWALTFNCGEVPHFAHFTVYWVAPLSAFFLSKILLGDEGGGGGGEMEKDNEKKIE